MEPVLEITQLAKTVPGGRLLFEGLDLAIAPGELVALTGESGAGKSTLLNLVAGLDRADRGTVRVGGTALGDLDEDGRAALRRRDIGFVFQAFHILPHLTLARNVALPLVLLRTSATDARRRADAMLAEVGLDGRGDDFPRVLSGGELQRVAIARALVHAPRLILADEPTGNLDPETAARVLALFVERIRATGAAALLVTHSAVAAAAADRTLRLADGRLTG